MNTDTGTAQHRVVIIGSGFGGLFSAQALADADVEVTLISRTTHHLFQPLLYQVATGILSEGEIAPSTREVLARQANVRPILGDVTSIDLADRTVTSVLPRVGGHHEADGAATATPLVTPYDSLIVATGSTSSYFGNDGFAEHAPGLKTIDDALEIRGRIFGAFEVAEVASTEEETDRALTFVVVGAGPTGVELAGQIAELSRRTLRRDFRRIDAASARVVLLDAADAVLPAFGPRLGRWSARSLERLGVDVRLGTRVVAIDAEGLDVVDRDGEPHRIEALTKIWAAGVKASGLADQLAAQSGSSQDRAGRLEVNDDLTLPGHPEVFVVGDLISLRGYPGVAQLAIQGGRYAADRIVCRLERSADGATGASSGSGPAEPARFEYRDRGSMATIARFSAVARMGRVELKGFVAWVAWLALHLVYIIGFKSRVTTLLHWTVSFVGRGRSERTVTEQQVFARVDYDRLRSRPPRP
ncbi:MAG: NAD(P)/FAD-dependent oxidoreductase [Acidimicrobiales bacterium]